MIGREMAGLDLDLDLVVTTENPKRTFIPNPSLHSFRQYVITLSPDTLMFTILSTPEKVILNISTLP